MSTVPVPVKPASAWPTMGLKALRAAEVAHRAALNAGNATDEAKIDAYDAAAAKAAYEAANEAANAAYDAAAAAANAANAAYNAYIEARIVVILDDADARD